VIRRRVFPRVCVEIIGEFVTAFRVSRPMSGEANESSAIGRRDCRPQSLLAMGHGFGAASKSAAPPGVDARDRDAMSALNIIKQRDRVVLATDGAVYDVGTGALQGFPAKQATMPSLPAVFATRGSPLATPTFAHLLGLRFQSFDDLVARIENELPDVHARVRLLCRGNVNEPIVIAGWSRERNRPEAYFIRTAEQHTVRYTELAPDRFKNFWRD
jgi:hypothetical protein